VRRYCIARMLQRYTLYQPIISEFLAVKFPLYYYGSQVPGLSQVVVQAGVYKVNSMLPQHHLIMSAITGGRSLTKYQIHGKRKRRTISSNVILIGAKAWYFVDKFLHEMVPLMSDYFKTPKFHKHKRRKVAQNYTLRVRQKFNIIEDFYDLVAPVMHDTHKGYYLPLTIHLKLRKDSSHFNNETYLRMLRLPILMYRRKARLVFDDKQKTKKHKL